MTMRELPESPETAPEGDELPLAAELQRVLERERAAVAALHHLAPSIVGMPLKLKTQHWPKPGPPKPGDWSIRAPAAGTGADPGKVLELWMQGGEPWLQAAERRWVRAAATALHLEDAGPLLGNDPRFVEALLARLRDRDRVRAVAAVAFAAYPWPRHAKTAARSLTGSTERPRWWRESGWPIVSAKELLAHLGLAVLAGELQAPGDLDLPIAAWREPWASKIIEALKPSELDHVRRQLAFADGGKLRPGGAINAAVASALGAAFELARRGEVQRRDVAILARERVGNPFGANAEAVWAPVRALLPVVRAWLAGEVLGIVFEHLTPRKAAMNHMTAPRKSFWRGYTSSVRRMWVAATSGIRPQLKHPDLVRLKETMGDGLLFAHLYGCPDQAVVWMHLEGRQGLVTVLEGNANTSLRIRPGELTPPGHDIEYYSITRRLFPETHADVLTHASGWQGRASDLLARHGIIEDRR
jgi:hypothetical protein